MTDPPSQRARRSGAIVSLTTEGALVPAGCACCGEPAARTSLIRSASGKALIVGYCDECAAHAGREETRKLASGVAAALLGGGLALSLPFAARPPSIPWLVALVLAASLLPILFVALVPRRPGPGHTAEGPAVRFTPGGELLCASDRYATDLARANGEKQRLATFRERRLALPLLVVPPVAVAVAVATLVMSSPLVRVVNLGPERVSVEVDGRSVVGVEPTSVESASAGAEVRIAAGGHELVARAASGRVVERASVTVEAGHAHLFAPGSEGYCFWLETAEYGREGSGEHRREPLEGPPHFWALPPDLGGWFRPVPEQALAEVRLTGGAVTVLRQAPCGMDL